MSFNRSHLKIAAMTVVALFVLSGCNTTNKHIGEEDPYFGESVKYDTALQTINPDPVYPPSAAHPGSNGEKGAKSVLRYRTDAVKAVEATQTSTGGSSSH
jgi:predicted small secreted protein